MSGHDPAGQRGVSVLPWHAEHPPHRAAGSIYADAPPFRPAAGHQVWVEVHPSTADLGVARDDVDGALVVFIEPGTKDVADSGQLSKVADLSGQLPIAVDGGITRTLASRCREHGASLLIAGRALLAMTSTTASPRDATRSERGFQP